MKTIVFLSMFCVSCSTVYYQLYKTESNNVKNGVYEQDSAFVYYNFWGNKGNGDFIFFNNSSRNVYIDLGKSHLIVNGSAQTYFQNRTFSTSETIIRGTEEKTASVNLDKYKKSNTDLNFSSAGNSLYGNIWTNSHTNYSGNYRLISNNLMVSNNSSVSYNEERIVVVPPKSYKMIIGFNLNSTLYTDNYLIVNPYNKNKTRTQTFLKNSSPIIIKTIISYKIEGDNLNNTIENLFWVTEITNYSIWNFNKDMYSPVKFYLIYSYIAK